jgi:1-aminocyclopropane-1-carboxylate deaminase/D-cysteine desulfhydrase-like pyridoxal-dependent ACC family enzyme
MTRTIALPMFRELGDSLGFMALIDDRSSEPLLGGNKARKLLGGLLDDAHRRGAKRILTFGAHGSHHVLASAVLGAREGFEVHALLWPQAPSAHATDVLEAGLRAGLHAHHVQSARDLPHAWAALRIGLGRGTYVIPLGGSTPASLEAHARATRELVATHPAIADLDAIVLPLGSGGTALGVALGLAQTLGTRGPRVHGTLVSHPSYGSRLLVDGLLAGGLAHRFVNAHTARLARARLVADGRYIDPGYGAASARVLAAMREGATLGLALDPTYTGKAFAAALDLTRHGERVAFWMTLGRVPHAAVAP